MNIFLTGATGYIGGSLAVRLIADGHSVHGLVRSAERAGQAEALGITPVMGSLDDLDVRSGIQAVGLGSEENRAIGRQLPKRAIGSTLLLKGLEADHVIVLNADSLDAANFYVAITRGAKSITSCSSRSCLDPK